MLKKTLAAAALIALQAGASNAAVVFHDDFSSYGTATVLNAPDSLFGGNWSTGGGTIDYLAAGDNFGNLCQGNGNCIDLDGSTGTAGLFSSIVFGAGRYTLDLGLIGSGRNTSETVTVTLGSFSTSIGPIASGADASSSWTFSTNGGSLSFQNGGGDNIGAILTSVKVSAVPLPAGGLLLLTALGGVAALRRKRKAA